MKLTKRDVKFFLFGLLAMFIIETIYDWEGTKQAVKDGWAAGMSKAK